MHGFVINGEIIPAEGKSRLELYGVLEDETPFVWTEEDPYILGFVLSGTDLSAVKQRKVVPGKFKTMDRKDLDLVYFDTEEDSRAAQNQLPKESLVEWDVSPIHRFLMEKKIRGGVFFENEPELKDGVAHFHKPAFKPSTFRPKLRVMSFDIEIGVESRELYSLAIHVKHIPEPSHSPEDQAAPEITKVWMLAPRDYTEGDVDYVDSEEKILLAFLEAVKTHNPQVFIGWNVVQFDFDFLIGKYLKFGLPMNFGIGARPLDHFKGKNNRDLYMKIPGRAVLDGIPTLRALGFQMERWSLDHVSRELLGEGKLISPDEDKIAEIEALFKDNKAALADYNLKDTTLVTRIFEKAEVLEILMERQGLSGTLIEKQNFPSEILDSLYLPALHRLRLAGPTTPAGNLSFGSQEQKPIRKGVPGYFSDVAELSFADFFPNLLESFLIDPLGRALGEWLPDEGYVIPGNALRFHRKQHLLPAILSELRKCEAEHPDVTGKAAHSLRQALRQALDSQYSRFYSPSQNAALRHIATLLIAETNLFLESLGMRILFADHESIFFHKPDEKIGDDFLSPLAVHLAAWSEKTFQIKASPTPILLGTYGRFFIPVKNVYGDPIKSRAFAGLREANGKRVLAVEGMEGSKFDAAPISGSFLRNLLDALFRQLNPVDVIERVKSDLQAGKLDAELVYSKRLRKDQEDIPGDKAPPHVIAARKMAKIPPSNLIAYRICESGPEPVQNKKARPDYRHYQEKVLAPVAEMLLAGTAYENAAASLKRAENQLSFF